MQQLTINDIAAVVQVIDIVTARGAFRGDELSQIGALRDRYAAFVGAAQAAQSESEAQASDEAVDSAADTE